MTDRHAEAPVPPPASRPTVSSGQPHPTGTRGEGAPEIDLTAPPSTPAFPSDLDVDLDAWCSLAFEATPIGIAFVSPDRRPLVVNPALCRILGRDAEDLLTCSLDELTHPDDRDVHREHHRRLLAGEIDRYSVEKRYLRPDGTSVWTALHVVLVRDGDGRPTVVLSQCEDISAVKAAEEELRHQAHHDALTGLLNRRRFLDLLAGALDDGWGGAVLFVDVDEFKQVNDRHGHAAGDHVLVALARRLSDVLRPTDLVARFGGDELVAFVGQGTAEDAVEVARRVSDTLHTPIDLPDGSELPPITLSIGIAVALGGTVEQLLHDADAALYRAKEAGRDRIELHR